MPGAVKRAAMERGLPVLQPERMRDEAFLSHLRALRPDLGVVAAYGRLLPQMLLDVPASGMINVHASELPRWRGAAPVHRAILAGDTRTGVTIMKVVLELDAGPIVDVQTTEIEANETSVELERRLSEMGADLLLKSVARLERGEVVPVPQDAPMATYAPRLTRADSQIDWTRPASAIHNQIRGLHPWPLAGAVLNGRRVSLLRAEGVGSRFANLGIETRPLRPGTVIDVDADAFSVLAGDGNAVRVVQIQEAGRAAMDVRAYLNGRPVRPGDRLEPLPE